MLVLVSFVLVLAAAVTLVVGLLQSGLTLIYLSIGCSVLAGVVLAIAVLRGRPEPKPAAAGRTFTPPAREPVGASVGASSTGAETTTSWTAPSYPSAPPPPSPAPPPPKPSAEPAQGDDLATKAAGSALLGRLRKRQESVAAPEPVEPEPVEHEIEDEDKDAEMMEPAMSAEPVTMEMPAAAYADGDDGFPIADYDRLRAIELLAQLPTLDRNQLEAVRQREAAGKNRFTVMNRVDALLATKAEPAWEVEDEEWAADQVAEDEPEEEPETVPTMAGGAFVIDEEEAEGDEEAEEFEDFDAVGEMESDEVDELVSQPPAFPIAGYESLTVGQILPRLSHLDADELAQVRAREQEGRNRGTILDRIDRLATKSGAGAVAMPPPAPAPAPKKARARKAAPPKAPPAPAPPPAPVAKKAPARAPRATKKAIPVPPAPMRMKEAVRKARATKAAPARATPAKAAPARATKAVAVPPASTPAKAARKIPARKAAAAVETTPMKEAVKRARSAKKATKRR